MRSVLCRCVGGVLIPVTVSSLSFVSIAICLLVITFFGVCSWIDQIDMWSANFLFGLEVEIKGGRVLFGLHLERGAGMLWELLVCNFSVGSGMCAML